MRSFIQSFVRWFENNGRTISSLGLVPLIIPTLLNFLSDLAHHGWITLPLILVDFLAYIYSDQQQLLFCIYSIGFNMVIFGQLAHYNKATRKKPPTPG